MGKGEESGGGREKTANLAGAMEAVIAAAFLDQGLLATKNLVLRLINDELSGMVRRGVGADDKSQLQELVQSRWHSAPVYRLVETTGPEHDRTFKVEVMVDDDVAGMGSGKSKKLAETEAARSALKKLKSHFTE
jgi:ribonuclease-3